MLGTEDVPAELVQGFLRDHLADPAARLTDLTVEPLTSEGFSGNALYRARLSWARPGGAGSGEQADWVLKRWRPGGLSEVLLGLTQPVEALAWEHGLLRPRSLPAGLIVPILGARVEAGGAEAWVAMDDVAADLSEYTRQEPRPGAEVVRLVRQILDKLALLHVWWEQPAQQARLAACSWLLPWENQLWREVGPYAAVLGRPAAGAPAWGRAVTSEFREDLHAFLAWLPPGDRRLWEDLLCDRRPLVRAFAEFPRTLLHGDADDRNIGLRWPRGGAAADRAPEEPPALVLIDWEWMGQGPAAFDIAKLVGSAMAVCDPSQPLPQALGSGELLDYYFERYAEAGGKLADRRLWRRSCDLVWVVGAVAEVPGIVGFCLRNNLQAHLDRFAEFMEDRTRTARTLLT